VIKKRSKKISLLLVLMMLATMFISVGTASAVSTYSALSTPTVLNNDTTQTLGTIQIDITQMEAKTQTLLVTLPIDFEMPMVGGAYVNPPVISVVKSDAGQTVALQAASSITQMGLREFKVNFTYVPGVVGPPIVPENFSADSDVRVLVSLPLVKVPGSADGEIKATLTALAGNFSSGSVVVAKAGSGAVTATVVSTATITESGSASKAIEVNFAENTKGAVKIAASTLELKLPKGFTWVGGGANLGVTNITTGAAGDLTVAVDGTDARKLVVTRAAIVDGKSIYRLSATVAVDDSIAVLGDVEVSISGNTSVTPSSLIVGTFVSYGVTADSVSSLPVVKAGQLDQDVADFTITETAAGSILNGRSITMELPAGAKWYNVPNPTYSGSLTAGTVPTMVGTDGRTLKFTVNNAGGSKGKVKFENVTVMTAVDFSGELKVTLSGAGLASTSFKLAEVQPAITGKATATEIKIGVQAQDAGVITLTEATKETLINNEELELELPTGIQWTNVPKVEVTEGNLDIDVDATGVNGRILSIRIKSQSTTASTITISGIKLDVDRTVPEGNIKIKVAGPAVDEVNDQGANAAVGTYVTANSNGEVFPRNTEAAIVIGAKCVTPAPGDISNNTVFTFGSTTYTINGIEKTMDVAPYAKNNRTYMPIRYVAYALGIDDSNIIWDQTNQTVTLMKGDKVVQLKLNSNVILINGASVAMDVVVEASNNRTFLPAAWVAQAFGATATWDSVANTVTIK
jgi:hypothetical protein